MVSQILRAPSTDDPGGPKNSDAHDEFENKRRKRLELNRKAREGRVLFFRFRKPRETEGRREAGASRDRSTRGTVPLGGARVSAAKEASD